MAKPHSGLDMTAPGSINSHLSANLGRPPSFLAGKWFSANRCLMATSSGKRPNACALGFDFGFEAIVRLLLKCPKRSTCNVFVRICIFRCENSALLREIGLVFFREAHNWPRWEIHSGVSVVRLLPSSPPPARGRYHRGSLDLRLRSSAFEGEERRGLEFPPQVSCPRFKARITSNKKE